jgi:hypothetical protein
MMRAGECFQGGDGSGGGWHGCDLVAEAFRGVGERPLVQQAPHLRAYRVGRSVGGKERAASVDPAPPLVMTSEQVGRISAWGMKRSM